MSWDGISKLLAVVAAVGIIAFLLVEEAQARDHIWGAHQHMPVRCL